MINAKPSMNGNSVEDFKKGYFALTETQKIIEDCMSDMSRFVVHGRNYQHLPTDEAYAAQEHDREHMKKLGEAILAIRAMKSGIEKSVIEAQSK